MEHHDAGDHVVEQENSSSDENITDRKVDNHKAKPEFRDQFTRGTPVEPKRNRDCLSKFKIPYFYILWSVHIFISVIVCVDRFVWMAWPRQSFQVGAGTSGTDHRELLDGPWSVKFFDVFARISGRLSIWFLNVLLFTRMRSVANFFTESYTATEFLAWIDFSDLVNVHLQAHRWNGIVLAAGTFIHVWSIFMPCVFNGWGATVLSGDFEYPLSERAPSNFIEMDVENSLMMLQVDDVWRLVNMTILLCIVCPVSVWWMESRWHIGIQLHNFMMTLYFIDIVRRHTHPHSWCLNTPFYVAFFVDLLWSRFMWKRDKPEPLHRNKLGEDYMVVYWNHKYETVVRNIGHDCYLLLQDAHFLERAHIFTTFENSIAIDLEEAGSSEWTRAGVLRVFHTKRSPALSSKENISHTHRIYESTDAAAIAWGPTQGEMSKIVQNALDDDEGPVCLVGAGSGVNFLIDAAQKHNGATDLYLFFTTRDKHLYRWVGETFAKIFAVRGSAPKLVVLALTGAAAKEGAEGASESKGITFVNGRLNFLDFMPEKPFVFCQGSYMLKKAASKACEKTNGTFYGGLGGGT